MLWTPYTALNVEIWGKRHAKRNEWEKNEIKEMKNNSRKKKKRQIRSVLATVSLIKRHMNLCARRESLTLVCCTVSTLLVVWCGAWWLPTRFAVRKTDLASVGIFYLLPKTESKKNSTKREKETCKRFSSIRWITDQVRSVLKTRKTNRLAPKRT